MVTQAGVSLQYNQSGLFGADGTATSIDDHICGCHIHQQENKENEEKNEETNQSSIQVDYVNPVHGT